MNNVRFNGVVFHDSNVVKYRGVKFDKTLTWNSHMKQLTELKNYTAKHKHSSVLYHHNHFYVNLRSSSLIAYDKTNNDGLKQIHSLPCIDMTGAMRFWLLNILDTLLSITTLFFLFLWLRLVTLLTICATVSSICSWYFNSRYAWNNIAFNKSTSDQGNLARTTTLFVPFYSWESKQKKRKRRQ